MCQLTNLEALNEETESKIGNYVKKLSKIGPFKNFDFWPKLNAKSQNQPNVKVNKSTVIQRSTWSGSGHQHVEASSGSSKNFV